MVSLIKTMVGAAFLGVFAYTFFFVDLGGQSLASHFGEIWQTPVVQTKVSQLRTGVQHRVEERLAKAGEQAGRHVARAAVAAPAEELSDADRQMLVDVIERADEAP